MRQRTRTTIWWSIVFLGFLSLPPGCGPLDSCSLSSREIISFFLDCECETEIPETVLSQIGPGEEGMAVLTELDKSQIKHTMHKASKVCGTCHSKLSRFGKDQTFVKPMPDMCYDCHGSLEAGAQFVHGPVAVGACMFCHKPHQSDYNYLLKMVQPKLCKQCHDNFDYEQASEKHPASAGILCTQCHNPHADNNKMFLKE